MIDLKAYTPTVDQLETRLAEIESEIIVFEFRLSCLRDLRDLAECYLYHERVGRIMVDLEFGIGNRKAEAGDVREKIAAAKRDRFRLID